MDQHRRMALVFQHKLYYITVFHNNRQFLYLSTSPLYVELYDLKTAKFGKPDCNDIFK